MSEDGGSAKKAKQGAGKRLNDRQRVEIIQISENSKISKRQLAEKYGVSEAAIRKLLLKKDEFLKRYYDTPEEIRDQRLRGKNLSAGHDIDGGVGVGVRSIGGSASGSGAGSGATGAATGAADSSADAGRAAASIAAAAHAKTLYPPDDPWKHGLHVLASKIAPFLKSFVRAKPVGGSGESAAAAALLASSAAPAPPPPPTAIDWIGFSRMLRDIRRAFHRYPELGYHEVRTHAFIRRFCETTLRIPAENIQALAATGLVVDVGRGNARVTPSDKRKPPVLAFRADMDALPVEEVNDRLPYCSTQTKARKELRRRKRRKTATATATAATATATATATVAASAVGASESTGPHAAADDNDVPGSPIVALDGDEFDIDALNGVTLSCDAAAHMCGHDGHMVVVLGLCALVVRSAHLLPPDAFVRFIFQPAEEGPGGAQRMIEEGALEGVDEIYGIHNFPFPLYSVHVRPGPVMAHEVLFKIDIEGVGGHGSAPQQCVDPILAGAMVVQALQSIVSRSLSPTDTAVVSVTQFSGGDANNVIPSHVALAGTIRDFDLDVAEKIKTRMETIVHSTCAAVGATARVHFVDGYAPVINPFEETRHVQQVAMDHGLFVSEQGLPLMASEDFAYFLQARKGCFIFLGTKEEHDSDTARALHSTQYDFNDKALPVGIRLFLGILQSRLQCELYSVEDLQAFQVAMERVSGAVSVL